MSFAELIRFVLTWAVRASALLFVGGLIVRMTLRDRVPILSILHYATPLPVLVGLGLFVSLALALGRRPRLSIAFLLVSTLLTGVWFGSSLHRAPWSSEREELRAMFWNTARGRLGYARVLRQIDRADPDVACFLEAPGLADRLKERYPEREVLGLGRDFACVADTPMRKISTGLLGSRGRYAQIALVDREINLIVTDVFSDPWRFRGPALAQVLELAQRSGPRTIVMGDFNTPYDSAHFDPYRATMRHAFSSRGRGFIETWPLGIPLLAIDHVWVSRDVHVLRAKHVNSWASDHAAVLLDVNFPGPPPALKNVVLAPAP